MAFSDLFADNLLLKWLRGDRARHDLAVAMVGLKLGERFLLIGCGDGGLLAGLGGKVRLHGRACGTDTEAAAVARASAWPSGPACWSKSSKPHPSDFPTTTSRSIGRRPTRRCNGRCARVRPGAGEAWRLVRPGGRCVVIRASGHGSTDDLDVLGSRGFRGAHVLADRGGQLFIEAVRARTD